MKNFTGFVKNFIYEESKRISQRSKKYTLKNRCKPAHEPKFLREYFFLQPKKNFFPPFLFSIKLFFQRTGILQTCTDIASNVNRFVDSVCGLETVVLRGKSTASANRKINANFKKGGFIGYQTFALLMKCVHDKKNATEESGKKLYLFVAFFLTNSIASNPPFLKLRLSLMRYRICYGDSANLYRFATNGLKFY